MKSFFFSPPFRCGAVGYTLWMTALIWSTVNFDASLPTLASSMSALGAARSSLAWPRCARRRWPCQAGHRCHQGHELRASSLDLLHHLGAVATLQCELMSSSMLSFRSAFFLPALAPRGSLVKE